MVNIIKSKKLYWTLFGLIVFLLLFLSSIAQGQNHNNIEEVSNTDSIIWLSTGGENNRYITCSVDYNFDKPLDQALMLDRIKDLIKFYEMFNRNVIEINRLPYWQKAKPDWDKNFYKLGP